MSHDPTVITQSRPEEFVSRAASQGIRFIQFYKSLPLQGNM